MARTMKNYNGVDYIADKDFDYTTAIGEAVSHGDYDYAASLEKSRNAKIDGEGLSYAKTYKYQNGTSPVYKSKYGGKIENTLSSIINRKPFSYDYTKDDSYKALEKAYIQNGKLAMQDTLGDAAALTGGRASTAAISASQQAYNRYMTELATNIPALEQAAYGRYMDEEASLYNQLGLYQQLDNADYSRWNDSWERDHRLSREAIEDSRYDEEIKYRDKRDAVEDSRYDEEIKYRDKRDTIEDGRYDDQITYGREQDTISRLMEIASSTGDYSILRDSPELAEKYGFTEAVVAALNKAHAEGVSEKKIALAFARAQYIAQYGDFSYFKEAGFTDEQIAKMEEYWEKGEIREDALLAAQFGDYSLLRKMGLNPQVQTNNKPGSTSITDATSQPASTSSASGSETDISSFDDNFFDERIVVTDGDGYKGNITGKGDSGEGSTGEDVVIEGDVGAADTVEDYVGEEALINIPGIFGGGTAAVDLAGEDTVWYGDDINDTFDFDAYNNQDDSGVTPVKTTERSESGNDDYQPTTFTEFKWNPIGDYEYFHKKVEEHKGDLNPEWLGFESKSADEYYTKLGENPSDDDMLAAVADLCSRGYYEDAYILAESKGFSGGIVYDMVK